MGRIVVSENVCLDGGVQDPTGEEGFSRGGWFTQVTDSDRAAWAKAALSEALAARALLLGRRSYEYLAARWPHRSGALAERLNDMPKYVASSTLGNASWNNSAVLNGDAVDDVARLKQELDGEIVVYASFQLVRTLLRHGLVDQVRLTVYPFVLGAGARLFGESDDAIPLRLVGSKTLGDGLAFLAYEVGQP
jgi:dihydrofolate reductase